MAEARSAPLLKVKDLRTHFYADGAVAKAVDGVSFDLASGTTLGMVGESGCGKSVTALSILRLISDPPGRIVSGEIWFEEKNLLALSEGAMRKIRGNRISMIFQEPMTSLNPVFTAGSQVAEVFRVHRGLNRAEAWDEAVRTLDLVRMPLPAQRAREYPHQMSGGMRQRVMIAMALACNPALLIADEPTTALDVTVQAQILKLMRELQERLGSSILMITHDLGVIAETAAEVAVMYGGMIVEQASAEEIFENSRHPYTRGLLRSVPRTRETLPVSGTADVRSGKLEVIEGTVPDPAALPSGCRFHPRCPYATAACSGEIPQITVLSETHYVRCYHYDQVR